MKRSVCERIFLAWQGDTGVRLSVDDVGELVDEFTLERFMRLADEAKARRDDERRGARARALAEKYRPA